MQVLFSEEFSFDLKSQVEKSTRLDLKKANAICNCCWPTGSIQQATTSVFYHLSSPFFTEKAYMDHKTIWRHLWL